MALARVVSARATLARVTGDQRLMREAIAVMTELRADPARSVGDPARDTALLALMHSELAAMTDEAADLAAACVWFAQATAEFEREPGHPQHGLLLATQARLERRAGDGSAALRSGLAALRVRARDALLQTGPAHGLATARVAAAEAVEIAGWCLADGAAERAVEALELGRGLVLHAATSAADMPELLGRAGRADLADEWRRWPAKPGPSSPGTPKATPVTRSASCSRASRWRCRATCASARSALDAGVLVAPPDHREIAGALRATGADALVYLLQATADAPGCALIVPADGGRPRQLPLPLLHRTGSAALQQYEAAHARVLAVPRTPEDEDQWRLKLGALCGWAWTTVLRPLLADLSASAASAASGPPRLVLVPIGRLGVVPWHAARRAAPTSTHGRDGPGWRYAIADAVFSYAASGRQLAEGSRRPALPLADDPVIVAPANDLTIVHKEASALRERYPNARYFGFSVDGPVDALAEPDAVLGVLPARDRPGASLLHLVCHGVATSAGAEASYLVLDDDRALTVKAILRQAAGRPPARRAGPSTWWRAARTSPPRTTTRR